MSFPPKMGFRPEAIKLPPIQKILRNEVQDAAAGTNNLPIDVRGRTVFAIFGRDVDNAAEINFDIAPPASKTAFEETNFPLIQRGMTAADVGASLILDYPLKFPDAGRWRIVVNIYGATLNDRIRAAVLVG